jgi:hypothetical protein
MHEYCRLHAPGAVRAPFWKSMRCTCLPTVHTVPVHPKAMLHDDDYDDLIESAMTKNMLSSQGAKKTNCKHKACK